MKGVDLYSDGSDLPPEIQASISEIIKKRDIDIAHQIALMENGVSIYTDRSLSDLYGISKEYLDLCRKKLRDEIESFKDRHKYGKTLLQEEIIGRIHLYKAAREAAINGDIAKAQIINETISVLDKSASLGKLESCLKLLKGVGEDATVATQSEKQSGNTYIFNQRIAKMDEALAAKKKAQIVDVTPKLEDSK